MSSQDKPNASFSDEALAKMLLAQGKKLEKTIIHLWQNILSPEQSIEIIDNLQLWFSDGSSITIACHPEQDALDIIDYDFEEAKKRVESEFKGKIKLFAIPAGKTKMWNGIEGLTLNAIQATKENGYYKADSLLLDFGIEKRTVSLNPNDGLVIDYYEE